MEEVLSIVTLLTSKGVSLKLKGKIYASCVRSCMIYGSETWPMKKEHEIKLETTEMRIRGRGTMIG
jgi:hypothetical protein